MGAAAPSGQSGSGMGLTGAAESRRAMADARNPTIPTYDPLHRGRDEGIRTMFERLNTRYARVWHGGFDHVVQPPLRIASRFRVENTLADGSVRVKHNCNFFHLDLDGGQPRFDQVVVYMSGDNSLA